MLQLAIAYSNEDQSTARRMAAAVEGRAEFEHFTVGRANEGLILSDLLENYQGKVLLLISDNFLTNANCMLRADEIFSDDREVLSVVIDAHRYDETNDEVVTVKTVLATRADFMHYVSHWQDRYIELRRGAGAFSELGGESFDNYLRKIREASKHAEEFLELLQEQRLLTDAQFASDNYRELFRFAGREDLWQPHASPAEIPSESPALEEEEDFPEDLSTLPGLEWLAQSEETTTEPEEPDTMPQDAQPEYQPPSTPTTTTDQLSPQEQAENWIRRAWTMSDAGDTASALELLNLGRENFPGQLNLHYQYALMLALSANQLGAARRELDTLLESYPDHTDGLFLSGELHLADENYASAREDWEHLAVLAPLYPDLNQRLGQLIYDQFPDDRRDAAVYLKRAAKHGNATADTLYRYASLLDGPLDRRNKAIKVLQKAIAADPEHAQAHYKLAVALFDRGKIEKARKNFRIAVALEPSYDTAANRRAFSANPKANTQAEALSALKRNIAELEEMLSEREEPAPAPAPRPGEGKTVMISGATSGIGLATAKKLARDGYRLIVIGRREERLEELAAQLRREEEIEIHTLSLDVRRRDGVGDAITRLPEEWSEIDILINNAGKAKGFDPIHAGDLDHWDEMIDVNLKGLLYLTRAVTPGMVARGKGMVINVASTAGKEVYPNGNVYCATKHAVDALTYAMRLDLVKHGIKVGQICPAHVEETEFALVRFDGDAERAKIYNDFQPLRSSDVADAIYFMISQPPHVNVMDMVLQGTQQASSTVVDRSGRDKYAPEEE